MLNNTPPPLRRQGALLEAPHKLFRNDRSSSPSSALNKAILEDNAPGDKRKREVDAEFDKAVREVEEMAEVPTEAFGAALGVTSIHNEQKVLPFALNVADEGRAHTGKALPYDQHVLLLLDLSGSMRTGAPSGVDGLQETLASLTKHFAESTGTTKLTILGFSSSCGGLEHNHSLRDAPTTRATSVSANNPKELAEYCELWASKCQRVNLNAMHPQRECGGETNYEGALRAASALLNDGGKNVLERECKNCHVYLCTDGAANFGATTKMQLRRIVNEEIAKNGHFDVHALMIGSGATPCLLSGVINGRGILGYASSNNDLSNGVVELLEKTLKYDSVDAVVFVKGTMSACSLGTSAKSGILTAKLPKLESDTKEVTVEMFYGKNIRNLVEDCESTKAALLECVAKGECAAANFTVPIDNTVFWLPEEYTVESHCFTTSNGEVVWGNGRMRVEHGIFNQVYEKAAFAESCEEALSAARSHGESVAIAQRMAKRAMKRGHAELARRCDSVRKESEQAQKTLGPARSASHFGVSQFSQG